MDNTDQLLPTQCPAPTLSQFLAVLPLLSQHVDKATRHQLRLSCKQTLQVHDNLELLDLRIAAHELPIPFKGAGCAAVRHLLARAKTTPHVVELRYLGCHATQILEENILALLLRAVGTRVSTLRLKGSLALVTAAAATAITDALPLLACLELAVGRMPSPAWARALLELTSTRLQGLTVLISSMKDGEAAALAPLCGCVELRSLSLTLCASGNPNHADCPFLESLAALTKLHSLELRGISSFTAFGAALPALTQLTRLRMAGCVVEFDPVYLDRGVASALLRLHSLRELSMPDALADTSLFADLCTLSTLTSLEVYVVVPPVGADDCAVPGVTLPPELRSLTMHAHQVHPAALAAVGAAAPPSLKRVSASRMALPDPSACQLFLDDFRDSEQVQPSMPALMRQAAALLSRRGWPAAPAGRNLRVSGWLEEAELTLAGPHAPWLHELAPLACTKVTLEDLKLATGDLAALAAAAPGLEILKLIHCIWPDASLLELAPLARLRTLTLAQPAEYALKTPLATAALQELCATAPALELVELDNFSVEAIGGEFDEPEEQAASRFERLLKHMTESLRLRGVAEAAEAWESHFDGELCWSIGIKRRCEAPAAPTME